MSGGDIAAVSAIMVIIATKSAISAITATRLAITATRLAITALTPRPKRVPARTQWRASSRRRCSTYVSVVTLWEQGLTVKGLLVTVSVFEIESRLSTFSPFSQTNIHKYITLSSLPSPHCQHPLAFRVARRPAPVQEMTHECGLEDYG